MWEKSPHPTDGPILVPIHDTQLYQRTDLKLLNMYPVAKTHN